MNREDLACSEAAVTPGCQGLRARSEASRDWEGAFQRLGRMVACLQTPRLGPQRVTFHRFKPVARCICHGALGTEETQARSTSVSAASPAVLTRPTRGPDLAAFFSPLPSRLYIDAQILAHANESEHESRN